MGLSSGVDEFGTIERIDAFCDAVPRRRARAEEIGPLVLFVPVGPGWPYYARPRLGREAPLTSRSSVDLPQPLGPVTRISWPGDRSASMSRRTHGPWIRYRLLTPRSSTRPA